VEYRPGGSAGLFVCRGEFETRPYCRMRSNWRRFEGNFHAHARVFGFGGLGGLGPGGLRLEQAKHFVRPGEFPEIEPRSLVIRRSSFFRGWKNAEVDFSVVHGNPRGPFRVVSTDAFEPGPAPSAPAVASILSVRGRAQVCDPIIGWIAVPVIDLSGRMLAMDVEPRQPVGVMNETVDSDHDVAIRSATACLGSGGCGSPRYPPMKTPRLRGVIEDFTEPLRGQAALLFTEHGAVLFKRKSPAADRGSGREFPS
jgi:hypothetical protein